MLNSENCQKLTRRQKSRQNLPSNISRQKTNPFNNESRQFKVNQKYFCQELILLETNPVKIFHENDFPSKTNPSKITVSQKRKPSKTFAKNKFRRKSPSKNIWSKTNPVKNRSPQETNNLQKTSVRKITRQNLILLKTYNVS